MTPDGWGQPRSTDLGNGVALDLVWIAPGSFTMGSPSSEADRDDDETQHRVTLIKGFWMGKYEVTQEQWQAVMGSNPSKFKGSRCPVEQVSWDDCQEFIQKLNQMSEIGGQRSGGTFRLPTEAEWEYACRAGDAARFSFGDSDGLLHQYGNYCELSCTVDDVWKDKSNRDGYDKTAPVGSFKPNGWGLYDMHGNVSEWCGDWYGDYPSVTVEDPQGASSGSFRVTRGGGWLFTAAFCRSANRYGFMPSFTDYGLGFRVVLAPVP